MAVVEGIGLEPSARPDDVLAGSAPKVHERAFFDVPSPSSRSADSSAWSIVSGVIHGRQNVGPRRLLEPGPDSAQLEQLIRAAASAPDHGLLVPWRFVLVPQDKRSMLADAFEAALVERDPLADQTSVRQAREKAFRGPVLLLSVARLGPTQQNIPEQERLISLGCAIQNLLLAAQAMGYSCGLVSGQALTSNSLRSLFRLQTEEVAACFVSVGTASEKRPVRPRPQLAQIFQVL